MLFQRLYNWIKYKTLPPSILFKNRLFIERDSKHKRIFNNFGLVFRNSKWTNYENYGIKTHFRLSFYKYILLFLFVIFLLIFLINFKKYYIISYFFNLLSFFFWTSVDAIDYYFSFIIWICTVSSSLLFNLIYSYFFFNNFSDNKIVKKVFSHKFFPDNKLIFSKNEKNLLYSKHDFNWIFFFWLNNDTKKNPIFLENIFNKAIKKNEWNIYSNFFIKLYKIIFLCKMTLHENSIFDKRLGFYNNFEKLKILNYFSNTIYFFNYAKLIVFFLNNDKNYFRIKLTRDVNNFLFNQRHDYNIFFSHNISNFDEFLLKNKNGLFFLKNSSFGDFFSLITRNFLFFNLSYNVSEQVNAAKWNRWLYRYSILHRKILKNSHKITLSKRLINSGFYDFSLFEKNIWAAENFLRYEKDSNVINTLFNLYYPNFFENFAKWTNHQIFTKNNTTSLYFLNYYENSFFWFIKRFFFFNSLHTNQFKNKKNLFFQINKKSVNYLNLTNEYFNNYSMFLIQLLKSPFYFHEICNNFYKNNQIDSFFNKCIELNANYTLKDTYLFFENTSILSIENLNILYWITSVSSLKRNLVFANYVSSKLNTINFGTFLFSNSTLKHKFYLTPINFNILDFFILNFFFKK